jgi:Domain of unknown function (DUF6378)
MTISAIEFLERAADLMLERGQEYDSPEGERSMARTVTAFNVLTGNILSEQDGWMFMLLLKLSRQAQTDAWHQDSSEDAIAYAALMAEAWQKDDEDDSDGQIEITFRFTPGDDEDA